VRLTIGVSGRARHGKTEFCKAIAGHVNGYDVFGDVCPGPAKLYDIGDAIRRYCISTGRLPKVERKDMTRAQLEVLIDVGREKRLQDEDFWIRQVAEDIKEDRVEVALIPNLRYQNEAKIVRQLGGYVVRLARLNENGSVYISDDRPANDISETDLEFWSADFYFSNKNGHAGFVGEYAVTLYEYLKNLHEDNQ
jgi:hypothetical protein